MALQKFLAEMIEKREAKMVGELGKERGLQHTYHLTLNIKRADWDEMKANSGPLKALRFGLNTAILARPKERAEWNKGRDRLDVHLQFVLGPEHKTMLEATRDYIREIKKR
jgi:hypothetical protein